MGFPEAPRKQDCPAIHPTMNWVKAGGSGFLLPLISCVLWSRFKNSLGLSVTLCIAGVAETYLVLLILCRRKPGDTWNLLFPDVQLSFLFNLGTPNFFPDIFIADR